MDSVIGEPDWRIEPTEHLMGMSHTPSGTVVVRRLFDGPAATGIEVVRAEPRTRFSNNLLSAIAREDSIYPAVRLEGWVIGGNHYHYGSGGWCFCGALLHIDGDNQHVVYRIGEYDVANIAWDAAWPD